MTFLFRSRVGCHYIQMQLKFCSMVYMISITLNTAYLSRGTFTCHHTVYMLNLCSPDTVSLFPNKHCHVHYFPLSGILQSLSLTIQLFFLVPLLSVTLLEPSSQKQLFCFFSICDSFPPCRRIQCVFIVISKNS